MTHFFPFFLYPCHRKLLSLLNLYFLGSIHHFCFFELFFTKYWSTALIWLLFLLRFSLNVFFVWIPCEAGWNVLWMWDLCYVDRAYFRKAGHACSVDKKEHFSKFRAIRTRKPLKQEANLKFWEWKNFQKNLKGHCVVFRTQKVSRISPGRRICFHINILIFRFPSLCRMFFIHINTLLDNHHYKVY